MAFKISKSVSNRPWSSVDKTRIRQRLVKGLKEKEAGVERAIREVYAVIKGSSLDDSPSENWWGPHHEVRDDGTIVLNRNGLHAAAAALNGARANPNLTPEQRRAAARHLLRHYRELGEEPPKFGNESLEEIAGYDIEPETQEDAGGDAMGEDVLEERRSRVGAFPKDAEVIEAIHADRMTRNRTYYTEEAIRKALKTWVYPYNKPVLKDHNTTYGEPLGRVVGAEITRSVINPEYITARLYLDIRDPEAKQKFEDGRYMTFSIGASVDSVKCSICGKDILQEEFCGHIRGRRYDGKEAYWIIESIASFDEVSVVNVPSDTLATRITHLVRESEVKNEMAQPSERDEVLEALSLAESLLEEEAEPEETDETTDQAEVEPQEDGTDTAQYQGTENSEEASDPDEENTEEDGLREELEQLRSELAEARTQIEELEGQITTLEAELTARSEEVDSLKSQLDEEKKRVHELKEQNMSLARLVYQAYLEHAATLALFAGEFASREEAEAALKAKRLPELRQYCNEAIQKAPDRPEQRVENPAQVTDAENGKRKYTQEDLERLITAYLNRQH